MSKDQTAPGSLEFVREFVNTIDLEAPASDQLAQVKSAKTWFSKHGLAHHDLNAAELGRLRCLREAIRGSLSGHPDDRTVDAAWTQLAHAFGSQRVSLTFVDDGVRLEPCEGCGEKAVTGALAAAIYDAVRDGTWRRLKVCRKHSCLYAFYDHSKNGSGAWCNMAVCGNRMKAARRRGRERDAQ